MSGETSWARRPLVQVGVLAALSLALVFSGCATTLPVTYGAVPSPAPSLTVPSVPVPSPTPSTSATPVKPAGPFDSLSAKAKKEFKGCLTKSIGPGSGGKCAKLTVAKLKAAGFYPWKAAGYISAVGANAILNFQRSRGLTATARTTTETWVALATKAPSVSSELPAKCTTTKGVILCVDQAHRKLSWIKNGKVVKTFKVRLGGWNKAAKKDEWRVFGTANGTWKVFDKQVSPASENYGSGAMPYSTMFHPDMYVHYSPGFHSVGYASSSHGCVNIGKLSQAQWIFSHTPIGATVYIYSTKAPKVSSPPTTAPAPPSPSVPSPAASPTS
jgi:hypothetical protein